MPGMWVNDDSLKWQWGDVFGPMPSKCRPSKHYVGPTSNLKWNFHMTACTSQFLGYSWYRQTSTTSLISSYTIIGLQRLYAAPGVSIYDKFWPLNLNCNVILKCKCITYFQNVSMRKTSQSTTWDIYDELWRMRLGRKLWKSNENRNCSHFTRNWFTISAWSKIKNC